MKLEIYTIRDSAAVAYGRPFYAPARGAAIRSFSDEVNRENPENPLYSHPADFELYYLGVFDDSTGELISQVPELVIRAVDVKTSQV